MIRLAVRCSLAVILAGVGLVSGVGLARADCTALISEFKMAVRKSDLTAIRHLYDQGQGDPSCTGRTLKSFGYRGSLVHARAVQKQLGDGASLQSQEQLLNQALRLDRPWQVLAMHGDMHHGRKDYDKAAMFYQEALTVISDTGMTRHAPPQREIARVVQRDSRKSAAGCSLCAIAKDPNWRGGGRGSV